MGEIASQITSLTIVYSTIYSGADQREHQSSASLAFVRGIHCWPVDSLHKGPVTRKMFPFDDVIMSLGEYQKMFVSQPEWCHNGHDGISNSITSLTIVYSTIYLGADQRKHQSSVSLAFVGGGGGGGGKTIATIICSWYDIYAVMTHAKFVMIWWEDTELQQSIISSKSE